MFSSQYLTFKLVSGEVMDDKHWSESHVSGGGGGGSNGHSAPTSISTTVTTRREIWLKTTDGYEKSFIFNADVVKARKGNQLDILCIDDSNGLTPVFVYNQAMDTTMGTDVVTRIMFQRGWGLWITGLHTILVVIYVLAVLFSPSLSNVLALVVLLLLTRLYVPVRKREMAFKQASHVYLRSLPKRTSAEAA